MQSGILLIDKPTGITSAKLITKVKKQCGLRKAKIGHTGTLDPLATGLLPLLLGEATKFAQYLIKSDKTYTVTAQLGKRTNTADSDGEVTETAEVPTSWSQNLPHILPLFTGTIWQVPPAYSALKQNGVPLYRLARAGKPVNVGARQIQIHHIEILNVDEAKQQFQLRVSCGTGTYIRSLVEDIASELGTLGHVIQLRREKTGEFSLEDAFKVETLSASGNLRLLPVESLVTHFPILTCSAEHSVRLLCGQRVPFDTEAGYYRFYNDKNEFQGLIEASEGILHPRRLLAT